MAGYPNNDYTNNDEYDAYLNEVPRVQRPVNQEISAPVSRDKQASFFEKNRNNILIGLGLALVGLLGMCAYDAYEDNQRNQNTNRRAAVEQQVSDADNKSGHRGGGRRGGS